MIKIIALIIILTLFMIITYDVNVRLPKKLYNKGKCIKCGHDLRHFDNDSQGGVGYCCDNCGYNFWI